MAGGKLMMYKGRYPNAPKYNKPKIGGKMTAKKVETIAKKAVLKLSETKHVSQSTENAQLYHNSVGIPFNGLLQLAQGDAENQRIGDEVIGRSLKLKFWLSTKLDRQNVIYRIILLRLPKDQETGAFDPMEAVTGNKLIDYINTEKYTPVFQKFVKIQGTTTHASGATTQEVSKLVSFNINLKDRKIKYENDSVNVKYQRDTLRLAIYAYDAYGTLTSDNIASYACNARFYFKDP